jgi:hypothetical protein
MDWGVAGGRNCAFMQVPFVPCRAAGMVCKYRLARKAVIVRSRSRSMSVFGLLLIATF